MCKENKATFYAQNEHCPHDETVLMDRCLGSAKL